MSEFKSKKQEMDREIERFMELLNDILPRYSSLLRKIDTYYRLKIKAKNGDEVAKSQIRKLKRIYMDALIAGSIICWN